MQKQTLQELSFEQKGKIVELRNGFFHLYSKMLMLSNAAVLIFNLWAISNLNLALSLLTIIASFISAIFLLYGYRLSFEQFDMYREDAEKVEKRAVWFGKQAWYLFCTGAGVSFFNISLNLI